MAFQVDLPFLIFKTTGVTLLGVTNRNLWIEIDEQLNNGKVKFKVTRELLVSSLRDLKQKALSRRAQLNKEQLKESIGWLSTIFTAGYGLSKGIDRLLRPACLGDFYYRDPECKSCDYRDKCKVEKLQRRQT
jgi:hypothetical protein